MGLQLNRPQPNINHQSMGPSGPAAAVDAPRDARPDDETARPLPRRA